MIDSWSNTAITFTVPEPDGPWTVQPGTNATITVVTDGIGNTVRVPIAGITVRGVQPSGGQFTGQTVTVNGYNFGSTQGTGYVRFTDNGVNWGAPGDTAAWTIVSWTNTQIVFDVPQPSGTSGQWSVAPGTDASFTVTNSSGYTSPPQTVAITQPTPTISSVSPTSATAGETVTITGSSFGSEKSTGYVHFADNGTNWGAPGDLASLTIDSWSDTSITFTVPNGQWTVTPGTTATVSVVNSAGQASNAGSLTITS